MKDLRINVRLNSEVTKETLAGKDYDEIFVATGAAERKLDIPGLDGKNVSYAIGALTAGNTAGASVLVIGGGLTGCEIAYDLAKKGKRVTVIEITDTILNAFGLSAANYNMLMELMDYYKVTVLKNASLVKYENGKATVKVTVKNAPNAANRAKMQFALGPEGMPSIVELPVDSIVVSAGYTSNTALYEQIKGDHVHLIGDAKNPTNVMDAIWAAYETAMTI